MPPYLHYTGHSNKAVVHKIGGAWFGMVYYFMKFAENAIVKLSFNRACQGVEPWAWGGLPHTPDMFQWWDCEDLDMQVTVNILFVSIKTIGFQHTD